MTQESNNPQSNNEQNTKPNSKEGQRVHRFVSNDFTLRAACVNATDVVREMQQLQGTYPLATVAVGRTMVGALLMASQLKEGQQVGLYFKGSGALLGVYAEAHFEGQVRGFTPNPEYQPANYENGLSVKEAIGEGLLTVARHQPFQKQPFQGTVEIISGEIGDDIAHYLHQSQQIRSIVSLGVYLDTYGKVRAAGGILLEVMPGVEDEIVNKIEQNYKSVKENVSKLILDGAKVEDLVAPYLAGIPYTELDHNFPLSYYCPCTKDRVTRALETFGMTELMDMINKNEKAEVICQICGRPYEVSVQEIGEIYNRLYKASLN